tara:strand:- start:7046 stop:7630 length:585 start_codon:yes stop_codon:yes gene_type:complete
MIIIDHRRNTSELLKSTPQSLGVEVDIRSNKNRLILHHDPFKEGEDFESWLKNFKHKFLILNVKEEGLESRVLSLLDKFSIKDFFFLDQSFPFLLKTLNSGESRLALRVSEYESIETALNLSSRVEWIWVDFFNKFPLDKENYEKLCCLGYKLCLVSPELQGFPEDAILTLKSFLDEHELIPNAVCTKFPLLWK